VTWGRLAGEHIVTYGQQVTKYRCDVAACHEFGECVRHSLECAGKLDIEPAGPVIGEWRGLVEDGQVYRLAKISKGDEVPWRFSLECSADGQMTPHGWKVPADSIVEVSQSAFNDFEHICTFAKEVAEILECDPVTVMTSIGG
jgi:hypothetical protein